MKLTVLKPIFAENASLFVNQAGQYSGRILIKKDHWVIDAKSILGLLALSLQPDQVIELDFEAEGDKDFINEIVEAGLFTR